MIGTWISGGFPSAVAARLGLPQKDVHLVRIPGPIAKESFGKYRFLIFGDLPPGQFPAHEDILDWVRAGGRLLYFSGLQDRHALSSYLELFGLTSTKAEFRLSSGKTRVLRDSGSGWQRALPPLRFHISGVAPTDASVLATTSNGSPAIAVRKVGKGALTIILGNIALPGGSEWLLWKFLPDVVEGLLKPPRRKTSLFPSANHDPAYQMYVEVLKLLSRRKKTEAKHCLLRGLNALVRNEPLMGEICLLARWLGKFIGDGTLALWALDYVLSNWQTIADSGNFEFLPKKKGLYEVLHEFDATLFSTAPLIPRIRKATDAALRYSKVAEQLAGRTEVTRVEGTISLLRGMNLVAEISETPTSPYQAVHNLLEARRLFHTIQVPETVGARARIIPHYVAVAAALVPGIGEVDSDEVRSSLNAIATVLAQSREDDKVFIDSTRILLRFVKRLMESEAEAWETLKHSGDAFAVATALAVLRTRQALQLDPLGFMPQFVSTDVKIRERIAAQLALAARTRNEGRPINHVLVFCETPKKLKLNQNKLLKFNLLDTDFGRRLGGPVSALGPLVCSYSGKIMGALNTRSASRGSLEDSHVLRTFFEDRESARLRTLLGNGADRTAIVTISGGTQTVRSNFLGVMGPESLVFNGTSWRTEPLWNAARFEELLGWFVKDEPARALMGLLADLRSLQERGDSAFHGTTLLVVDSASTSISKGKSFSPSLRFSEFDESQLARLLSEDLAYVIDPWRQEWLRYSVYLAPKKKSLEAVRKQFGPRGSRHNSGIAYSRENHSVLVLILSEDGGCLAARNGEVTRLWRKPYENLRAFQSHPV